MTTIARQMRFLRRLLLETTSKATYLQRDMLRLKMGSWVMASLRRHAVQKMSWRRMVEWKKEKT
jgi:hypothetical protein